MNVASVQAQWSSEPSCETIKEDQSGQAVNGELTVGWKASVGTSSKASWTVTRTCLTKLSRAHRAHVLHTEASELTAGVEYSISAEIPAVASISSKISMSGTVRNEKSSSYVLDLGLFFACLYRIIALSFETSNDQTTERTYEFKNEANKQCKFNVRSGFQVDLCPSHCYFRLTRRHAKRPQ